MASGPIIATVMTTTIANPAAVKTPPCAPCPAIELPVVLHPTLGDPAINAAQAMTVPVAGTISGRRASMLTCTPVTARWSIWGQDYHHPDCPASPDGLPAGHGLLRRRQDGEHAVGGQPVPPPEVPEHGVAG